MNPQDYLRAAYIFAQQSPDPSTQNGAVLVRDGFIIATGYNHFPEGVELTDSRLERPAKYMFIEHAERDVIYQAARNGVRTEGATMYCPWYACTDCARAIIQSGVTQVIGHLLPEHENNPRWKDSIADAMVMLKEAGVKCDYISGKIGGVSIRMNGVVVEP